MAKQWWEYDVDTTLPAERFKLPMEFARHGFEERVRGEIIKRMTATVQMLVGESRKLVPVRTGHLKRSLTWGVRDDGMVGYYGSNRSWEGEEPVRYWVFPEFAFGRGWGEPGRGRPYLRPPIEQQMDRVQAIWGAKFPVQHAAGAPSGAGMMPSPSISRGGGRAEAYRWGAVWGDLKSVIRGPGSMVGRYARKFVFRSLGGVMRQAMPPMPTGASISQHMPSPAFFAVAGRWGLYRGGAAMGQISALGRGPAGLAQRQFRVHMYKAAGSLVRRIG